MAFFKVTNEITDKSHIQKLLKMVLKGASYENTQSEKNIEGEVGNYNHKNRTRSVTYHKIFIYNQP